jgi:hypothetical protein
MGVDIQVNDCQNFNRALTQMSDFNVTFRNSLTVTILTLEERGKKISLVVLKSAYKNKE